MLVSCIHEVFLFCFYMQIFIDCGTTGAGILCHAIVAGYSSPNFEGIVETNHKHYGLNSQHRATNLIYHVPNLLFWDKDISAFLRGLRENVFISLNFVDVSATC